MAEGIQRGRDTVTDEEHEAACVRAQAASNKLSQDRHFEEQRRIFNEKRRNLAMVHENQSGEELAEIVLAKFKEIKNLAEDLQVSFENGLTSNNFQLFYLEEADRVADNIIASLRAGSVSIN